MLCYILRHVSIYWLILSEIYGYFGASKIWLSARTIHWALAHWVKKWREPFIFYYQIPLIRQRQYARPVCVLHAGACPQYARRACALQEFTFNAHARRQPIYSYSTVTRRCVLSKWINLQGGSTQVTHARHQLSVQWHAGCVYCRHSPIIDVGVAGYLQCNALRVRSTLPFKVKYML